MLQLFDQRVHFFFLATKMGTIVGDLHLSDEEIKGFPLKAKSFRNTATYWKSLGRVPSTSPPLYHHGVWICVCVRGLNADWGTETQVISPTINLYLLKRHAGTPLLFLQDAWLHYTCSFNRTACSAPVFIKYFYKNYFQHATLLKPSQRHLRHVMMICILFVLKLSMPLWEMKHTLDWFEWIVLALNWNS